MTEPVVGAQKTPAAAPWSAADIVVALLTGALLGALLVVVLVSATAVEDELSPNSMVGFVGALIYAALMVSAWFFVLHRRGVSWSAAGFRPVGLGPILAMVPAAIGLMILNSLVVFITRGFIGEVLTVREQLLVDQFDITPGEFVWLLMLGGVAAPLVEELVFRGLIFRYLRSRRRKPVAVVASAGLFALMHVIPSLLVPLFLIGVVLAIVADRYDSIYPSITLHALHNAVTIVILYGTFGSA
jgi:uncharacterized protein